MKKSNKKSRHLLKYQGLYGVLSFFTGLFLLVCGFFTPPEGEINSSVLIAYGESLTFVGSVIGIDYNYKIKRIRDHEDDTEGEERED